MKPLQNADGHVGITRRAYPIATSTDIKEGSVVKISGGLVVAAAANETGTILGIAAETHGGTADPLNPRNNGGEIYVYDNPGLIWECDAPIITASGGSATTVTAASTQVASSTADIYNGGVLELVEKVASSTNTDRIGTRKTITDYAQADSVSTFTVASAGTANNGEKFAVYPPVGKAGWGALDTARAGMVVSTAGATMIKCIGHDYDRKKIRLIAVQAELGVEN